MRTVYWQDGRVQMIDQRRLPAVLDVIGLSTLEEVAEAIRDMAVRGAPAIGAAGAYGMALAAQASPATERESLLSDLERAKRLLDATRPTAVNLSWATDQLLLLAGQMVTTQLDDIRSALLAAAEALADADVEINRRMGAHGATLVPDGGHLLHHCNTGSLATVEFGTALGVVFACQEQGKQIHVWVDETRPRLQGARLTAWELMQAEIPMHLIADSAAGSLLRSGRVDLVIFGADRVAANGDVANKIGTYPLAVVARENGVPVYCVAPTSTVDLALPDGDQIPIEERSAEELTHIDSIQIAPSGTAVYNPAFDITPHRYVTGIVTEEGICYPPYTQSLRRAKAQAEGRSGPWLSHGIG